MSTDRREKLKQAILQGKVKDEKSALIWVLKEKQKEQLVKDVIAEIPQAQKGDKGDKGDKGERGEAGKNGKNGKDGKSGKDAVVDTDKIVATATKRATQAIEPLIPDIQDIEKNLPKLGAEIRDGLELLQDEERLDASAIKNLPEHTEEIKKLGKRVDGLGGSQARNFYQLYDVPQVYAGQSGKVVSVKTTEDGLEFTTATGGHDAVTLSGGASTLLALSNQDLDVNTQLANTVYAGATSGGASKPNFRALVSGDIPDLSTVYQPLDAELTGLSSLVYASGTPFVRMEADGAFALDTNNYVPYTGANANVDLGLFNLTSSGLITSRIYPSADSTTALKIMRADGSTLVANFDTTNSRLKVGNSEILLNYNYGLVVGVASGAVTRFFRYQYGVEDTVEMGGSVNWFNITASTNGNPMVMMRQNGLAPILSLQDGATVVWQVLDGGNMVMARDNTKFLMGAGSDASMYYDGTDFIINPKEVGTGGLNISGTTFWTGDSTGLPYGEMYSNNSTQAVVISATDTFVEVDGNLTGGELNLVTFPDDHYLQVSKAGRYLINWSMSVYCANANQEVEGAVMIDGTAQTKGTAHGNMITANAPITISGTLILDLAATNQISLGLSNHTATNNIIMQHASLTATQIGGT